MFLFQIHTKTPSDRLKGEKNSVSAVPFFNCPKWYGRHFESHSTGMTKE
jgi:hypothetical protein